MWYELLLKFCHIFGTRTGITFDEVNPKYHHLVVRSSGRNWDDWLIKQCYIFAKNTGSIWDVCVMIHRHIYARITGRKIDG
jgi:hypothetical protein